MKQNLIKNCLLSMLTVSATWSTVVHSFDDYVPGSGNDPRVREAHYLGASQRYYSAVSELLQLQTEGTELSAESWSDLAEFQLSFGMHDRAQSSYKKAIAAPQSSPIESARLGLRLAEFEYQRGYLDAANASLLRARDNLPDKFKADWADQYARVLIAQKRFDEAIKLLEAGSAGEDSLGVLRYNLGAALIMSGRVKEGRAVLDRLGRLPGKSEPIAALRDRANTVLGWHLLQNQLGAAAQPLFLQVRSRGFYSNRALLGLGWAELASSGMDASPTREGITPSQNTDSGRSSNHSSTRVVRGTSLSDKEKKGLLEALVAWQALSDGDPQDPSVHEAWLAVPYALDKLGERDDAIAHYEQASQRLEAARARTAASIEAIKTGRMVKILAQLDIDSEAGWMWKLEKLADVPETYYLQSLIADHPFMEGLKNYRDVRLLGRKLDAWDLRLATLAKANGVAEPLSPASKQRLRDLRQRLEALRPTLGETRFRAEQQLQALSLKELTTQENKINKCLVELRLSLAQLYDRSLRRSVKD